MTLKERCDERKFLDETSRYAIYDGRANDLYIALPDYAQLQRCFTITFDKEGIEPPVIEFHNKRYLVVPPFSGEDKGYITIHGRYKNRHGLHKIPIHRLAYIAFYGHPTPGFHIHHLDKNKKNNAASNLVAITPDEHCRAHGRDVRVSNGLLRGSTEKRRLI